MQHLISLFLIGLFFFSAVQGQNTNLVPNKKILETCQYFNGENDFVNAGSFRVDSSFTFSLWFKSDDLLSKNATLVNIENFYWLKTTTHRELVLTRPNKVDSTLVAAELSENIWHHLTVVINLPKAELFLNGISLGRVKLVGAPKNTNCNFVLGRNDWREFFTGQIANFQFYDYALDNAEVNSSYIQQTTPDALSNNVVAYLSLDDKSVRRNQHQPVKFSSVQFVKDLERGNVASFDSSSYIDLGNAQLDNMITMSMWIKTNTSARQALISAGNAFAYRLNSKNNFLFTIPQVKDIYTSESLMDNKWQHIAVTYHEKKSVCFYLNGNKIEEVKVSLAQKASKNIRIGNNLWNDHFNGYLDDIIIWKRVLNEEEIMKLSNMTSEELKANMPKAKSENYWFIYILLLIVITISLIYYYKRKRDSKISDIHISQTNPFKEKVQFVIQSKLSDSSFGVDQFAELMAMSKTSLYNNMKSQFKKSPKEYIREERLKEAEQLILSSSDNISEIIFSTGFESRAFFNKCFKAKYGSTPSEYRKSNYTPHK